MLLGHDRDEQALRRSDLLAGYENVAEFDRRELYLVEALRTLRLIHYSAWIARRWNDPAFPAAFPWFEAPRYWESRILELRERIAAMQEVPLMVQFSPVKSRTFGPGLPPVVAATKIQACHSPCANEHRCWTTLPRKTRARSGTNSSVAKFTR